MELQLSTISVAKLAGASVRQVDYWARTNLLVPSGAAAKGKGTKRRYTFPDLVALKTVRELRERGCPLQTVRTAVRYLQKHYPDETNAVALSRVTLLTDGKKVYIVHDEHSVMDVVTRQHVWSIALGRLILEAREQVKTIPAEWIQPVKVDGRTYHLTVISDSDTGGYTVQCRELPGAIEQGETPQEAIANGKDAIRSVRAFQEKRQQGRKRNVQAG